MSREQLELGISNLVCRLIRVGTDKNNEKLGQRVSRKGYVTYF